MFKKEFLFCTITLFLSSGLLAQKPQFTPEEEQWIQTHPVVYFGYGYQFKPFEINDDSIYKGIAPEYIKIISNRSGLKFVGKHCPDWESTYQAMKRKEIDILPNLAYTKERAKYILFVKPHFVHPLVIVTRKNYPFVGNLEAFKEKKLSLPKDYASSNFIIKNLDKVRFVYSKDVYESLVFVSTGMADGTVADLPVVSYFLYYEGFQNLKIAAPLSSKEKIKLGFGVRKDYPILKSIIEKTLATISIDKKNKIYQKWISVQYNHGVNMEKVKFYSIAVLVVVAIIFTVILLWNRMLKTEITKRKKVEFDLEASMETINKKNSELHAMLQEIHHRVKNNLQIISSLLKFQAQKAKSKSSIALFEEAQNRIRSMSLLHERLYQSEDLKNIDVNEYFTSLVYEVVENNKLVKDISIDIQIRKTNLNSKTLAALGLMVNEIISNSLKHAFKSGKSNQIYLKIQPINTLGRFRLEIGDNGVGVNETEMFSENQSMGAELIQIFVAQLDGKINIESNKGTGTHYKIEFSEVET